MHFTLELSFPDCIWTAGMEEVLTGVNLSFSHLHLCWSSFPVKEKCPSLKNTACFVPAEHCDL